MLTFLLLSAWLKFKPAYVVFILYFVIVYIYIIIHKVKCCNKCITY